MHTDALYCTTAPWRQKGEMETLGVVLIVIGAILLFFAATAVAVVVCCQSKISGIAGITTTDFLHRTATNSKYEGVDTQEETELAITEGSNTTSFKV